MLDPRLLTLTITEGEDIIRSLHTAAAALCDANDALRDVTDTQIVTKRTLKEAEADLSAQEAEIVAEATMDAIGKTGPLAGIATSSKAYAYALEALLNNYHTTNSTKSVVRRLQIQAENSAIQVNGATTQVSNAATRFAATKHAADLKAAIIRAIAL